MSDDPILAALAAMEARLMARMNDNHENLLKRMDNLDEHMTLGLGHADRVERQSNGVAEQNRLLGEQMTTMHKLLRQLEGRINDLEASR